MAIATPYDLALLLGDDDIDQERAEALLETATVNCSLFVSPVPVEAKGIVVAIAARAYSNSTGVQSETTGPYTATYGSGFIGLLPTTREEKLLKRMAGQGGAFSIDTLPTGTDAVQLVTVSGSPTGGFFRLTLIGQETADVGYNASSADVLAALTALSQIGSGNVSVTGEGPYTITFINNLRTTPVPTMTADSTGLTPSGTVNVSTVTRGVFAPGQNLPYWDRDYSHWNNRLDPGFV